MKAISRGALVVLMALAVGDARATITQVDGTIVPTTTDLQTGGLDASGDGFPDVPSGTALDAVLDASQFPEVFLPNTANPVTFADRQEQAGFENSFGWYNVGDDVFTLSGMVQNLHPILGCGAAQMQNHPAVSDPTDPAHNDHHHGDPAQFVFNAEVGSTVTVDFAAEQTAGRYKGGFIGFYLITPEGRGGSPNCGDYLLGGSDFFGFIYFTQADLNNDGDFVHSMVYTSRRTADRFYFAFEDLFRGGDNDFTDMLIQVTGLTPPCVPQAEICDGLDNDCDGLVDGDDPNLTGVGVACTCDGAAMPCAGPCPGGVCQGTCLTGVSVCNSATIECISTVAPVAETCNTLDDNCNGSADEGLGGITACDGTDGDLCDEGFMVCVGGVMQCDDNTATNVELCNGNDDDCDGTTDENPADAQLGLPCDGGDLDLCTEGVFECSGGGINCSDTTGNNQETCDGVDDDCDGTIDEGSIDVGGACSVGIGFCQRNGATICSGGVAVCNATPGTPGIELCNGVDDDCDTLTDETFNVGQMCDGVGECGPGVRECAGPSGTRCSTDPGGSADESIPEVCNGLDDDCDGKVDEGLSNIGTCGTNEGECSEGVLSCVSGAPTCLGEVTGTPEICDNLDNDCNGTIDDSPTDVGRPCGATDVGECSRGLTVCNDGLVGIECSGEVGPAPETCDGLDNDCDGLVDAVDPDIVGLNVLCGATDLGECEFGRTICLGGITQCSGEIGPAVELCDGLDNDCNGTADDSPIDVGTPCGSGSGVCTPGTFICQAGARVCDGQSGGSSEICDGIDNDCNGLIDDSPAGVDAVCGETVGVCEPGLLKCIAGDLECVGGIDPMTEQCNGIDDDCDGMRDEGDLCAGGVCLDGACSVPCANGEFTCPVDQMCQNGFCIPDPCFGITCPNDSDGGLNVCEDGTCLPICDTVSCPDDLECRKTDGLCVPNNCNFLPLCEGAEICRDSECVTDPCADVTCGAEEFCRTGDCVGSCAGVECLEGFSCRNGECTDTGCATNCPAGRVCDPATATCVSDPCPSTSCPPGRVCNPSNGECEVDPCTGVECPGEQVCERGDCFNPSDLAPPPDAGPDPEEVYAAGGGGCAVAAGTNGGSGSPPWLLLIGLLGAAIALSRGKFAELAERRRAVAMRAGVLFAAVYLLMATAGCNVDGFCINCETGGKGDDAAVDGDANDGGGVVLPDAGVVNCDAGVIGQEICDGEDNDCDGEVDEDFNFDMDPLNCGMCGKTCLKDGTSSECNSGQCEIIACLPGSVDLNQDLGGPFDSSDGCEYTCFESNGGVEACDGLDNDCDGDVDEETSFTDDESNCGQCGRVCGAFQANVTCTAGTCGYNPATDCVPGFNDINLDPNDGCEYECTVGGVEICDYIDNDCNGTIDDGFDLQTSPTDCGQCGHVCTFFMATPRCGSGRCFFNPATDCAAGFVDANGNQLDGCEYLCTPTGIEVCDGVDNDCDGVIDDSPSDAGASCHNAPGPTPAGVCTETGTVTCVSGSLTCVGAPSPQPETCDGLDNDCDGTPDDNPVDEGALCAAAQGVCSPGLTVCNAGGSLDCVRAIGPQPEVCNGLDDNCNGIDDDMLTDPGLGLACGSSTGVCNPGVLICDTGSLLCQGQVGPSAELCDGDDDNCNGTNDDGAIDVGGPCGSSQGECVQGTLVCQAGGPVCQGGQGAVAEVCDNRDNDCDGVTDEVPGPSGGGPITAGCYTGTGGTAGTGECVAGTATCVAGSFGACVGEVVDVAEVCDNRDNNCNGSTDEGLFQACYSGAPATLGVGRCRGGQETCTAGVFGGACVGEVLPAASESCNGQDDDCNGLTDEASGGGPLSQSCYNGPVGTAGNGTCVAGTETCGAGTFGACVGEVVPSTDLCGDGLDTDCDNLNDAAEGCLGLIGEIRLDAPGGGQGSGAGAEHSFDIDLASTGTNVYAVWSDLSNGNSDIFFRRSTDGGANWNNIVTLTSGGGAPASTGSATVKPMVVAAFDAALGADRVYIVYQRVTGSDEREIRFLRSSNSGASFAVPSSPGGRLDGGGDSFHHHVALSDDGRRVAVVWEQLNTSNLERTIETRVSSDSGNNFTNRMSVSPTAGTPVAGRPKVAITSTGRYVYVWREARVGTTFDIYANFSDDGTSLGGERRLDVDAGDTLNSDFPQLVTAGNALYVAWQEISTVFGGGADTVFARNTNNGIAASWAAAVILDDPLLEVSSSFSPTIAVDAQGGGSGDDRVYVGWIDDREGTQVYMSRSVNGGAAFTAAQRATSNAGSAITGITRDPHLVFLGNDQLVVTYVNDLGGDVRHIFATSSIDAGVSWQVTHSRIDTGGGHAVTPAVTATTGGGVTRGGLVGWIDFRAGSQVNGDAYVRVLGN